MRIIRFVKRFINQRKIHRTFSLLTIIKIAWIQSKKDESPIPRGYYCYEWEGNKRKVCPYWSIKKDRPEQENGYCSYLEKGDFELNEEIGVVQWQDGKGNPSMKTKPHEMPISLLWDMCKECRINEYTEEEIDEMFDL